MKNILIIENNPEVSDRYADILKNSGYEVIFAINSNIGIDLAINTLPDLILCNTIVAPTDGFEVLSVLSANPSTTKIPFIFINEDSSIDIVKKGIEYGADDFITKPFKSEQLIRSVEARIKKLKNQNGAILPFGEYSLSNSPNTKGIENLLKLISQSKIRHIRKRQTIYYEGDFSQYIYLLVEGCIKSLKLTNDGRQLITGLYRPNSFIGLDNLFLDAPLTQSAETTENSSLYFIPKNSVKELLNEHVELNHQFLKILSIDLHEKEDQLVELAYESVRKRLAQVLIRLSKNSIPIDHIDISRDELAGLAGIATETVSRILTDFKENGVIERSGSQIQIVDLNALIKMKS